jgi:hypothetical protein
LAPDEADIGHLTLSDVESSIGGIAMTSIFAVQAFWQPNGLGG